jgi:hypothetical protein
LKKLLFYGKNYYILNYNFIYIYFNSLEKKNEKKNFFKLRIFLKKKKSKILDQILSNFYLEL